MCKQLRLHWTISALILLTARAMAQCGGEPASDSPCAPRVISGAPGVYEVIMDVSTAIGAFTPACGGSTHGYGVWFEVTPTVTGLLTFSTCHPSTGYDTVVQPWLASGDCEFPIRLDDLCVDDTTGPTCVSECQSPAARSSSISFHAIAGTTYLIQVSAYDANSAGCALCLGVRLTLCGGDYTPPTCVISDPGALSCACDPMSVIGTVADSDGGLLGYALEYAADGSSTWTLIESASSSIMNNELGVWHTSGLQQGLYLLRLTATNACGLTSTDVRTVWVDQLLDNLNFRSPAHDAIVGGQVCLDGTVSDFICFDNYVARYRPAAGGAFQPVDAGNTVYLTTVTNDQFAFWDTLGLPDGAYELQVAGTTDCGNGASQSIVVTVDNTSPTATITSPLDCAIVQSVVQIRGTASDANLQSWVLQYTGGLSNGWTNIASGSTPVINGMLANWNTNGLPACAYTLRLVVTDTAVVNCNSAINHRSEYTVSIDVGPLNDCPEDITGDGAIDLSDLAGLLAVFGTLCP